MSVDEIDADLNGASGLDGLCGVSDLRDVLEREAAGDPRARLALDVYVYRIRKYIGAYTAALGRVDAIVFTAGVGENSPDIRERACEGLGALGVELDETAQSGRRERQPRNPAEGAPSRSWWCPPTKNWRSRNRLCDVFKRRALPPEPIGRKIHLRGRSP